MVEVAVIILVGNEELHIVRCLEKLMAWCPRQIWVVESQRGDRTHELVEEFAKAAAGKTEIGAVFHDWPGTQARQFNWALDNLPIKTEWVLRLDADEYLEDFGNCALAERLEGGHKSAGVGTADGYRLELKRKFLGGEIRHGTAGIRQVRLFRRGKARYDETLMDERLRVDGRVEDLDLAFYDDNLHDLKWWKEKHRAYAKREAAQAVESMRSGSWTDPRKAAYYRLPRYWRAIAYWGYRYVVRGGFLDGVAGWRWHFWQGWWYRVLVDRELGKRAAGSEEQGR